MLYLFVKILRFSELRDQIPNITELMLTLQLKKMEENHLIKRSVYAKVPVRVEYALSELNRQLILIMEQLAKWGDIHIDEIYLKK